MMHLPFFLTPSMSFLSVLSGILFGFFLRKATVSRSDIILGQLLLKDFTVMKVILTAITVGSVGIFSFESLGLIPSFHLSQTPVFWAMIGGGIFGVGMSLTGYCPGTAVAALAEGSKDMIFGISGMLLGAISFNQLFTYLKPFIRQKGAISQQMIGAFFDIPNWTVIAFIVILWAAFVVGIRRLEKSKKLVQETSTS